MNTEGPFPPTAEASLAEENSQDTFKVLHERLLSGGPEKAKSDSRLGGFNIEQVKDIAKYVGCSRTGTKKELIDAIFQKAELQ